MNFWKSTQGIISIIIIIVSLIFLAPYIKDVYGMIELKIEKKNAERQEIINFQKEWNSGLPELRKKIENNKFTELAPNSKWERIMVPYGEFLPKLPNEKKNNSTLLGVDENNNGVRDDLEILTVKEFGVDREVVEVIFAMIRKRDYNIYIYIYIYIYIWKWFD